jgi:hypothetical protein
VLPWPLRIVAVVGQLLLRIRRFFRRTLQSVARALERVGRSPLVAAPIAALSVALVGLTVVGLVVAGAWWGGVEPPGPWQEALAVTGSMWVMAYGVPVRLMGLDYSLIPWGLVAIPLWLSHQAGRWLVGVVRPRQWRTLTLMLGIAVVAGAGFVAAVSVVADVPDVQTSARRALLMAILVGVVGLGSGLWRANDLPRQAIGRIPVVFRVLLRASFVGFVALVGLAALVLTVAAASSFGEIVTVFIALEPTVFDAVVLLVVTLGYLPTLIGWSLGYLVGAGVSLGPDVLVSPFVAAVPPTPLPTFPALAALPDASGPASWALPALIVFAGALVGLSISRWAAKEGPLIRIALALLSAVVASGWIFVFLWVSSGSLGDGRLAAIGPDAGLGALLAGVGLVIGAVPTSILRAQRRPRRLKVLESVGEDDLSQVPMPTTETPA